MSSSSTLEVPKTTDCPRELSGEENLVNATKPLSSPLPTSAISSDSSSEDEGDYGITTDDEYDIEFGTARVFPMRRTPVRRIIIRHRQTARGISAGHAHRTPKKSVTAPTSPTQATITTPHTLARRSTIRSATPPPAIFRSPPLIPQKSPKRYGVVLPLSLKLIEGIQRVGIPPPTSPGRNLKRASSLHPVETGSNSSFGIEQQEKCAALASAERKHDPSLGNFGQQEKCVILAPVAQRVLSKGMLFDPNRSFGNLYSASDSEKAEGGDEDIDWQAMNNMYEDVRAGRMVISPSPGIASLKAESEAKVENQETEVLERQGQFFNVADDGVSFRNPFVEQGMSSDEIDHILRIVPSVPRRVRNASKSIETAVDDESMHGLTSSPKISPRTMGIEKTEFAAEIVFPEPVIQPYDFISADSWSDDEERVEGRDEIFNAYSNRFALPDGGWTVLGGERSLSCSSDYLAPSRSWSPISRVRSQEARPYSPIANLWHAKVVNGFTAVADRAWEDSIENIVGLDVEALLTDTQSMDYELQNTDKAKGSLVYFNLKPHEPSLECGHQHCHRHYRPSHEVKKGVHDPNERCHCATCRSPCEKTEAEKERVEQAGFWSVNLDEIAAEDTAKAVESRLLGLPDFKTEEEVKGSTPQKTRRLGDWVKRHLRSARGG
jgi:hypothetical protein